ncbi:hypothetical protein BSL82_13285 [Tardibacter chloracetimidivorans]|uniref:Uncharacterized protein n=1 Tax=Tardibacter chloracetimidivorans TaxID=1921510 RepID=A0A1L3ZX00_9SPHN|nr:hypothetical protein [Tardibacter chloracetimidivorans]API60153.1 hypothetical protein BSL82_13285 [Tardibacter chloracetimidivorans]
MNGSFDKMGHEAMTAKSGRIVAIGLLAGSDLDVLGAGIRRVYSLQEGTDFAALLATIDQAEARGGKTEED